MCLLFQFLDSKSYAASSVICLCLWDLPLSNDFLVNLITSMKLSFSNAKTFKINCYKCACLLCLFSILLCLWISLLRIWLGAYIWCSYWEYNLLFEVFFTMFFSLLHHFVLVQLFYAFFSCASGIFLFNFTFYLCFFNLCVLVDEFSWLL